jgi:hypothetical protein
MKTKKITKFMVRAKALMMNLIAVSGHFSFSDYGLNKINIILE